MLQFFGHVVRPLLDMLSMAANLHRLEFLKGNISLLAFERTAPHHLLFTIICNAVYGSMMCACLMSFPCVDRFLSDR